MIRCSPSLRSTLLRFALVMIFYGAVLGLSFFAAQKSVLSMPLALMAENILPQSSAEEIHSTLPTAAQTPHAFPLSESELRDLAEALAPKVDLFRAVWEKGPEAEFFAGTTRDYLYWILGHFKGLENLDSSTSGTKQSDAMREKIEEIKAKLLATPFIKFNEIVGPESDADIMTKNQEALSDLRAEDFAIRKLDFISFDRAVPGQSMYQDEINQGYIPSEKIRLSKKGITTDPNFGNGVSDLLTGNLSIQFPDMKKFWKTHYAKLGSNHPLLLALRYVRIISQDYLQRHGSEIPDAQKLEAPMTKEIKIKIQNLIQDAISDTDGSFKKLLQNEQGKKWLNASIQKSFRSFTNANAAFELMKELGLLGLIEVYPNEIESVHQYLLKTKRDEGEIAENFKKFGIKPQELYENISDYLPNLELFHGTASELAFRNIIYQGVIPSEGGSAGRGLYGVSKKDLEFAKEWSRRKAKQDALVIALKLKSNTKIVDITQGMGKALFEQWRESKIQEKSASMNYYSPISSITASSQSNSQNLDLHDAFAQDFGIDILRYPYGDTEAFVLKNANQILSRRGVFKNPRPISELLKEAITARLKSDLHFLIDFLETPLTKDERIKIISILGEDYFKKALAPEYFTNLRQIVNLEIISLVDALLQLSFTDLHPLIWNQIPALLKDPIVNIRWRMTQTLANQNTWPPSLWNEFPTLMRDPQNNVRENMAWALANQSTWPPLVWNEVPSLLNDWIAEVRRIMAEALQTQSTWPPSFWNKVATLIKHSNPRVRIWTASTLEKHSTWPPSLWNEVAATLNDPVHSVRLSMIRGIKMQSSWPQEVIDFVAQSTDSMLSDLKGLKPKVLDLSSCKDNLSEMQENSSAGTGMKETAP